MRPLKEEELCELIKGGETLTVEFKIAPPRPIEVAERLCGMANAQGGVLIIGVEDKNFTIVGVSDLHQAKDVILRATRMIQPVLLLDPPEPEVYILDDKQLVVATVLPNRGALYQSSGVCWIRRSTHTHYH
jgi:ATP-dependent DNA helicase RecG